MKQEGKVMKLKYLPVLFVIGLPVLFTGCSSGETNELSRDIINPWEWQNKYGFVQANKVADAKTMLFCAGQISVDKDGMFLYPDDMKKQITQIADNLETLFKQADMKLSDIVRITYYTTDIQAFTDANGEALVSRLEEWGCRPATSLIGVAALARPSCLIELEVTAVSD